MTPTEALLNFRIFLSDAYPRWLAAASVAGEIDDVALEAMFDDWAQANWELLVERTLCKPGQFLELYGSGSDYEEAQYSRVFFRDASPTHDVLCEPASAAPTDQLSGFAVELTGAVFDRVVARSGSWYANLPPFDHVLLQRGEQTLLVRVDEVSFALRERGLR